MRGNRTHRFLTVLWAALLVFFVAWLCLPLGIAEPTPDASPESATVVAEGFVQTLATDRMKVNGQPLVSLVFPLTPETITQDPTDPHLWWAAGTATMDTTPLRWRLIERGDATNHWQLKSIEIWNAHFMLPL